MPNKLNTVEPSSYGDIKTITQQKGNVVLDAAAKAGHKVTRVFGANNSPKSDHRFGQSSSLLAKGINDAPVLVKLHGIAY